MDLIMQINAVDNADVLILIGARATDRTTRGIKDFAKNADVIHIDIDPAEIGKNLETFIPVVGDIENVLSKLIKEITPIDTENWINQIRIWKNSIEINKNSNR